MTAEEILVIFLSVALAIFLTLGIVLLAFCVKIASQISRIANKAEGVVDRAGDVVSSFQHATALSVVGNIFSSIAKSFGKSKDKEKSDE